MAALSYWDGNGTSAGAGTTPTGTWGSSNFWSATSGGTSVPAAWTSGNTAVFSAGNDASGSFVVTVSGTQTAAGITHEEGTVTLSGGAITLNGAGAIDVLPSRQLTISTPLGGSVGLTKGQSGTLILSGINGYSGTTTVNAGILRLGVNNALPTAPLTVVGGTFSLNGSNQTVTDLTFGNGSATTAATVSGAAGAAGSAPLNPMLSVPALTVVVPL